MTKVLIDRKVVERAAQAIDGLLEWCRAVPDDTPLPAMPGIDGDFTAETLAALRAALQAGDAADSDAPEDWRLALVMQWSRAYPRMDIYTRPGSLVMFDGNGGYDSEKKRAIETLTMRGLYAVAEVTRHSTSSTVRLVGVKGEWNTVLFAAPPASTGEEGREVIEGHSTSACGPDRSADARDAARYRWLQVEHQRVDPVAHLVWKRNGDRNCGDWVNTANLDAAIDAAMGTVSPDRPMSDGKEPQ